MSHKLTLLGVFVLGTAAGVVAGCQTYDFEPVEPLAIAQTSRTVPVAGRAAKPNLMLLVDKSGSMNLPINTNDSACTQDCGLNGDTCPANCRTRWRELKSAMGDFLSTYGAVGRMGLTFYPVNAECAAPALTNVVVQIPASDDVDSELQLSANAINKAIQDQGAVGGTPTGNALQMLGNYEPLLNAAEGREQFVVLLTDGLPNCNENNANDYFANETACRCTLARGDCTQLPKKGCLDKDNTVAQVDSLKSRGIKTIVIGFGAELASGTGPEVLNAMADKGGFARVCPTGQDSECGNLGCDSATKTCRQKFYQAANGDDLAKALIDIQKRVGVEPCSYRLESKPSDPDLLSVLVEGENVTSGADTWVYDDSTGDGVVKFQGALCTELQNATTKDPINVEFRVVEGL